MTNPRSQGNLITDQLLRELAKGDPMWAMGEISAQHQAILCMGLSDMALELLQHRDREANRKAWLETQRVHHARSHRNGHSAAVIPFPGFWSPQPEGL